MFTTPVTEIIRARASVRTYREDPIGPARERRLDEFIAALPPGPFGTKPRFMLISARDGDTEALKGLGTYGMIRHAAGFVAGAVQDHDRGIVLGETTWGKGLVQTVFTVRDTGLALTTARYYTPSGRCIQRDYESFIDYVTPLVGAIPNRGSLEELT